MKRFIHIPIALLLITLPALAAALPVGATSAWTTDLELRNPASEAITQKVGHLTFTHPGLDPQVIEPTVTLSPGETRWIREANKNFDPGMWTLSVDPRLDAAVFLRFADGRTSAAFEVSTLRRALIRSGDTATFYRIAVDPSVGLGAFPVIINTGTTRSSIEFQLSGPLGERMGDWLFSAPPGISQTYVPAPAPAGGTLRACLGSCSLGAGGLIAPDVFLFVAVGPADGATQAIRYAEQP